MGYWVPRLGAWRRGLAPGDPSPDIGYPDFMFWVVEGNMFGPLHLPPCNGTHRLVIREWCYDEALRDGFVLRVDRPMEDNWLPIGLTLQTLGAFFEGPSNTTE